MVGAPSLYLKVLDQVVWASASTSPSAPTIVPKRDCREPPGRPMSLSKAFSAEQSGSSGRSPEVQTASVDSQPAALLLNVLLPGKVKVAAEAWDAIPRAATPTATAA